MQLKQKLDGAWEGPPLCKLTQASVRRTCRPLSPTVPSLEPTDPAPHPREAAADLGVAFFFLFV